MTTKWKTSISCLVYLWAGIKDSIKPGPKIKQTEGFLGSLVYSWIQESIITAWLIEKRRGRYNGFLNPRDNRMIMAMSLHSLVAIGHRKNNKDTARLTEENEEETEKRQRKSAVYFFHIHLLSLSRPVSCVFCWAGWKKENVIERNNHQLLLSIGQRQRKKTADW